jgi:hypothetical protein
VEQRDAWSDAFDDVVKRHGSRIELPIVRRASRARCARAASARG